MWYLLLLLLGKEKGIKRNGRRKKTSSVYNDEMKMASGRVVWLVIGRSLKSWHFQMPFNSSSSHFFILLPRHKELYFFFSPFLGGGNFLCHLSHHLSLKIGATRK